MPWAHRAAPPSLFCISDPGEPLVKSCGQLGIEVCAVPGPTAAMSALAISGLPTGRFTFEGFLSVNKLSRREHLNSLIKEQRTMIFYEAPHKMPNTLKDMYAAFGDRKIAIIRELTKIHEQVIRTTLSEAAEKYADGSLKGEIVLILDGAAAKQEKAETIDDAVELARQRIEGGLSASAAAKEAAEITGFKKGEIYRKLIN